MVRDNVPSLQGLVLSHNSLRLANVKVVFGALQNFEIKGLNLEHNDIENVKDLILSLSKFPLVELKLEGNNCLRDIKNPVVYIKTVRSKLPTLKTLDGVDIDTYLASKEEASTSAVEARVVETPIVTPALVEQFLTQFYSCLDSEHRVQLLNAYTPNAEFRIESEVPSIPSAKSQGHDGITAVLSALPLTKHASNTFTLETVKCEPREGHFKVSGQVQVQGLAQPCTFVHAFSIVPYNSGLGCAMSVLGFR